MSSKHWMSAPLRKQTHETHETHEKTHAGPGQRHNHAAAVLVFSPRLRRTRQCADHRMRVKATRAVRRHNLEKLARQPEWNELGHGQHAGRKAKGRAKVDRDQLAPGERTVDMPWQRRARRVRTDCNRAFTPTPL